MSNQARLPSNLKAISPMINLPFFIFVTVCLAWSVKSDDLTKDFFDNPPVNADSPTGILEKIEEMKLISMSLDYKLNDKQPELQRFRRGISRVELDCGIEAKLKTLTHQAKTLIHELFVTFVKSLSAELILGEFYDIKHKWQVPGLLEVRDDDFKIHTKVWNVLDIAYQNLINSRRIYRWRHELQAPKLDAPIQYFLNETAVWLLGKGSDCFAATDFYFDGKQSNVVKYSTSIPTVHSFQIRGEKFQEAYYWDTYYFIKGMLAAGRDDVVHRQLENLYDLIARYGFIPSGLRTYYLDRSHPPILSICVDMTYNYLIKNNDVEEAWKLIVRALPWMMKEYFGFWMNPSTKHVVMIDGTLPKTIFGVLDHIIKGKPGYILNRYYSDVGEPRLENCLEDMEAGERFEQEVLQDDTAAQTLSEFYQSLRAASESGWDFSSRWSRRFILNQQNESDVYKEGEKPTENLTNKFFLEIDTINVIPVDLNALMYKTEYILHNFSKIVVQNLNESLYGKDVAVLANADILITSFSRLAEGRKKAMTDLMWDSDKQVWFDFYMRTHQRSQVVSAASIVPLWAGLSGGPVKLSSEILHNGCLRSTPNFSGQLWDAPNVAPPLVSLAMDYLSHEIEKSSTLSNDNSTDNYFEKTLSEIGSSFLDSALKYYAETTATDSTKKKVDTRKATESKTTEQPTNLFKFGWTNGVVLDIMTRFGVKIMPRTLEFLSSF